MSGRFNRSSTALARAGDKTRGDESDSGCPPLEVRRGVIADGCGRGAATQSAADPYLGQARDDQPYQASDGRSLHPALAQALFVHRQRLVSSIAAWVGAVDAEDVFQEACLKAIEKGVGLRHWDSAPAWLERVVRHAAIDYARHADAERRMCVAFDQDPTQGPDAAQLHSHHSTCRCGLALVSTLRASYADILRRVDVADESIGDVAVTLRMSPNSIRVRLHRARAALRARWFELCGPCAQRGGRPCSCEHERS